MGGYLFSKSSDRDIYLNLASRPKKPGSVSQYRGVSVTNNPKRPFRAALRYKGRYYYLGSHPTEREAAAAYNEGALRIVGDYAVINDLSEDLNGNDDVELSSEVSEVRDDGI